MSFLRQQPLSHLLSNFHLRAMAPLSTIKGFYRYTDVWFKWHEVVDNPDDAAQLKAILAHDSLVHHDHPLHEEDIEGPGVKLYRGTLENGQARLLFSSKQVEYIRYWLHEMQLTKTLVPLPYSDCLLTLSELRHVEPIVYKDGGSLRNANKKIDKENKRLKGTNALLISLRDIFERVRTHYRTKKGSWCAIDFEAWEMDHTMITEAGWSLLTWNDDGTENVENAHLTIKEHALYTNGKYVPERRKLFAFGSSMQVSKKEAKEAIQKTFHRLREKGPVFLVFHDYHQDIKYLETLDAPLEGLSYALPEQLPNEGFYVVDTTDLFKALEGSGDSKQQARKLSRICKLLQAEVDEGKTHNAGNDAVYTMNALRSMASGDVIDVQREKRWPNHEIKQGSVKVEFKAWEEDSDESDEEAVMGGI